MTIIEQLEDSASGMETINKIDDQYGISILNRSGATEYDLRFYSYQGEHGDEPMRLSSQRGEYQITEAYEDCEVGMVEFRLGHDSYRINFGHDGDEPFTACLSKVTAQNK